MIENIEELDKLFNVENTVIDDGFSCIRLALTAVVTGDLDLIKTLENGE